LERKRAAGVIGVGRRAARRAARTRGRKAREGDMSNGMQWSNTIVQKWMLKSMANVPRQDVIAEAGVFQISETRDKICSNMF
jgi:hypothetical protein